MARLSTHLQGIAAVVQSDHWSRGELEAFQSRCLRTLVRHAFERVPFYRDIFKRHGLRPEDIRGIEDLDLIPIANRSEMQERPPSDLVASGYDPGRLIVRRTGGSAGFPLSIRRTWFEDRLLHGVRLKEQLKAGVRPTDVRAVLCAGDPGSRAWQPKPPFWTRFGLLRLFGVNCLLPAREILSLLAGIQPDVLIGYPGSLAWIAPEVTAEDRRRIRPRLILPAAETLTPEMRRNIGEFFGAPVYDSYASHEFNLIAQECRDTGLYHVCEFSVIVEILKDGKPAAPGEPGELIGTALHSFASPFLRYRLGDLVTRGPWRCPCGAPVATLQSILGRIIDRFPLPGGASLHPYDLVLPLSQESPWLRRFQIVQTDVDRIVLKVVPLPGRGPTGDDLLRIRTQTGQAAGPGVTIAIELLDELPPADNGKFRPYYTLVGSKSRV